MCFLVGYHRVSASFAAGCGDCQHHAHGKSGHWLRFAVVEVPEIAAVDGAHGDGLGRVDGGAAANGQDEIHAFRHGAADSFVNFIGGGVGPDAAKLGPCQAFGLERGRDLAE